MQAAFNLLTRVSRDFHAGANWLPASFGTAMRQKFRKIASSKKAATAIEYGLIAALVAVAAMTAIQSVASSTSTMWTKVQTEVTKK